MGTHDVYVGVLRVRVCRRMGLVGVCWHSAELTVFGCGHIANYTQSLFIFTRIISLTESSVNPDALVSTDQDDLCEFIKYLDYK